MQELKWLEILPDHSLDAGIKLLNDLKWNLRVRELDGTWFVNAGHQVMLKTSSQDSVEAFLYGLSIAFSVLSKTARDEFRQFMEESSK
jgi:hypothetical protein